jgi:hypothetical protein
MEISLFGYKLNLEILILIGILYLILVGHTFCGCCNYNIMEGFGGSKNFKKTISKVSPPNTKNTKNKVAKKNKFATKNILHKFNKKKKLPTQRTADGFDNMDDMDDMDDMDTPEASTSKEGFSGANINDGESSLYDLINDKPIDISHWNSPNLTIVPGDNQQPFEPNEMDFFANTEFAPEYCPGTYSNSKGCAGMSMNQINYLQTRGGNNVPYSQY